MNFKSLSADKQITIDNFAPVTLLQQEEAEYLGNLYPKKSGKGGYPKAGDLIGMLKELSQIATCINALYACLRATIVMGSTKYTNGEINGLPYPGYGESSEVRDTYFKKVSLNEVEPKLAYKKLSNGYESMLARALQGNDDKFNSYVENFLLNKNHIPFIIKQDKTGCDILWVGNGGFSLGNSPLLGCVPHSSNYSINPNRAIQSEGAVADDLSKFNTTIAQDAYNTLITLNTILTDGAANNPTSLKRSWKELPVGFDFSQFNSVGLKSLGNAKLLPEGTFTTISEDYRRLSKFFSIIAVYTPDSQLASTYEKSSGEMDLSKVHKEFLVACPNISFSIKMHLPAHIAAYITQTPINEKVSYTSLCQWVSLWSTGGFSLKPRENKSVPYVVKASAVAQFSKLRKEASLFVEEGSGDESSVFITNRGTLAYCPKREALEGITNAEAYEKESDDALEAFFEASVCPKFDSDTYDSTVRAELGADKVAALSAKALAVKNRAGTLLAASWDYRKLVYAAKTPKSTRVLDLGGVVPDALALSSYISLPINEAIAKITGLGLEIETVGGRKAVKDKDRDEDDTAEPDLEYGETPHSQVRKMVAKYYDQLFAKGLVPSFQELINEAADALRIKSLTDEAIEPFEGRGIYIGIIETNLAESPHRAYEIDTEGKKIEHTFAKVLRNCGTTGALRDSFPYDTQNVIDAVQMSERYYNESARKNVTSDIKAAYKWLGGYIYYLSLQAIKKADVKTSFGLNEAGSLSFDAISTKVMPYVVLMSEYVPKSDTIYKKADQIRERNQPDEGKDVRNILVPGTSPDAMMFPHQINAHKILRNKPRFAAIDIQAGGGKTIATLADIACTIREVGADGKTRIKPIVICPDGLVKNWCEDMVKLTGSAWNMIPLNTEIYNRWKQDKLDSILTDAPINTIVVVSMSFLNMSQGYTVTIGGKEVKSSRVLEFIKNYGFNYVAIDEAHKIKRTKTSLHRLCKDLCNSYVVKYVRLLSGTMIPKNVKDIAGIAAMFSGQIFRTSEEFDAQIDSMAGKTANAIDRKRVGLKEVRQRFKDNIALVRIKRKEWAFLLPSPIEEFLHVFLSHKEDRKYMVDNMSPTPEDADGEYIAKDPQEAISKAHREIYEAVLHNEAEKVASLMDKGKEGGDDDSYDPDYDDDDDFESLAVGKYNFQRIDRITMDPDSDPFGRDALAALQEKYKHKYGIELDLEAYVPRKIQIVIDRLDLHYNTPKWNSQMYENSDMVEYNGITYIAKKREGSKNFKSTISPDKDTNNWRPEAIGKVLILCQYTDSIESLYKRLPAKYKEQCAKIYKGNRAKQNKINLNAFMKKDSGVNIVICQADRVTEGFNMQCFPAQTQVLVDYDKSLSFSEIYDNPEITHALSYNLQTRKIEKRKIINKWRHEVKKDDIYLNVEVTDNRSGKVSKLMMTSEHPIFLKGGCNVDAIDLKIGDQLITYGGNFSLFKSCPASNTLVPNEEWSKYRSSNYPCPECGELVVANTLVTHLYKEHGIGDETEIGERSIRKLNSVKRRWQDPNFKEQMCETMQRVCNDPQEAEARHLQSVKRWDNEERRSIQGDLAAERWQDQEYKESTGKSISKALIDFYSSEEGQQSIADRLDRYYENEEAQQRLSEIQYEVQNRPEMRQLRREKSAQNWQNDAYREKTINGLKNALSSPEARALKSALTIIQHQELEGYTENVVKAMLEAQFNLPNLPERNVIDLGVDGLEYTGDGQYFVTLNFNGKQVKKNPDFISTKHLSKKSRALKVVEVIGAREFTGRDEAYDKSLVKAYREQGIECLIVEATNCYKEDALVNVKSHLEAFVNNHYLTVTAVTRCNANHSKQIGEYKYDFEIEGNHNYFACSGSNSKTDALIPVLVHNCATRLIRVECPWTPGAIEQSNARLFRPQVGEARREYVFLDWIITDATLEVIKVGKLYNRTIANCQYDESDNTDGPNGTNVYEPIMNVVERQYRLDRATIGVLKDGGAKYPLFSDLLGDPKNSDGTPKVEYDDKGRLIRYCNMHTYRDYAEIRNREFEAMRQSGKERNLIPLITVAAPSDFKRLKYVPYVFKQEIADPYGFDYIQLMDLLDEHNDDGTKNQYAKQIDMCVLDAGLRADAESGKNRNAKAFGDSAIGPFLNLKAHFEGGYGLISKLYLRIDPKAPDSCPLVSVEIRTKTKTGGFVVNTVDANAVYIIPGKLNDMAASIFNGTPPVFSDEERLKERGKLGTKRPKVVVNLGQGKGKTIIMEDEDEYEEEYDTPVEGEEPTVVEPPLVEPITPTEGKPKELPAVTLKPVVYDKFVGVEIEGEDVAAIKEALSSKNININFLYRGHYASINIYDRQDLNAVIKYVKANNFALAQQSVKAITSILSSSFSKENMSFNIETAPVKDLKSFFVRDHTVATTTPDGATILKLYPLISHGSLDLVVDLDTNPKFTKALSHKIEGMSHGAKSFVRNKDNGFFIGLFGDKASAGKAIKAILTSGLFNVTNDKRALREDFEALKLHVGKGD